MFRSFVGQFFKPSLLTLDNFVFRLHYRVTVGLLLACAVALLWKINYGHPITCMTREDVGTQFLNDHCWYDGTFTSPSSRYKIVGVEVLAPGIGRGEDKEYHNVHRWVVIAVLVQAAFFYLPRILWRSFEGRLIHRLSWNMNEHKKTSSVKMFRKQLIADYLKSSPVKNMLYAGGHLFCELLNFINVFVQLFLVSHILQRPFLNLDQSFIQSRSERADASALSSFPLRTSCEYFRYGPSGDVQKHPATCVMSVNGVMDAIFTYQWIWFVLLAILSALAVLYRLVTLLIPQFRTLRLAAKASLSNVNTVRNTVHRLRLGEWFVLYMLSKNLDPIDTRDILEGLTGENSIKEPELCSVDIRHASGRWQNETHN